MKKIKNIFSKLLDVYELYIPMVLFAIVFVMYVVMIFYRYIAHKQVSTLVEWSQVLYVICAMMAAPYGGRTDKHAVFPLLYDKISKTGQLISRILGSIIIVGVSAMMIHPTIESIQFIGIKKTALLKIPFDILYTPFLIFIVLTMIYYGLRLIKDIRLLFTKNTKTEDSGE